MMNALLSVDSPDDAALLLSVGLPDDDALLSVDSPDDAALLLSVGLPDDDALLSVDSPDDAALLLLSVDSPDDEVSLSLDPLACLIAVAGKINEINNKSINRLDILFIVPSIIPVYIQFFMLENFYNVSSHF